LRPAAERSQHIGALQRGAQGLVGDMGVDLGGGDAGMAEQALHEADVDAGLDQERRRGVAQHVRGDAAGKADLAGVAAQARAHRLRLHGRAVAVEEERALRGAAAPALRDQRAQLAAQGAVADINHAVARALAVDAGAAAVG
jgi:hypothetical protein